MRQTNRSQFAAKISGSLLFAVCFPFAAFSQGENDQRYNFFTATVPRTQQAPAPNAGHPLMMPDAISTAAANFPRCLESLWPQAAQRGVSRRTFETATRGLQPDMKIMELLDAQPEFTKPVWEYLDILVNDSRIATGRLALTQNRAAYDAVEKTYGVDRYILTAIWGVKSNFGHAGRRAAGNSIHGDARMYWSAPELFP